MIGDGFSVFGFDLFGLSRRLPPKAGGPANERKAQEKARNERDAGYAEDRERSESFFWSMYPVY